MKPDPEHAPERTADETPSTAESEAPRRHVEGALAVARPGDPIDLRLAQAQAAAALFGGAAPDGGPQSSGLGRFRVLERLGAGGMGVVYAAYDPELDRGVALKLLRVPALGREAALAEAKALARLSHPHVVPVYDVGVDGDHVFIVMELIRGQTLGRWCKGRDRREIVGAYRQAGEGLAAAHAAGLVHRDFKPDNALVGSDGRVRVVDFGLAIESADGGDGRRAGTPRYMPPEQAAGATVTPAADQYSFCVALGEALTTPADAPGERPVPPPRWIADILERGRAADPAARFPSMRDLLHALGRDPAQVRRRRIALATVAIGGLGVFFAGRATLGSGPAACSDGPERLARTWTSEDRTSALARIAGLGAYGLALAPRLELRLGDHATRWAAGYRDACLAHRSGAHSDALFDRRMICLEQSRSALGAVADVVRGADLGRLPAVALALQALPDPDACADLAALGSDVPLPPPAVAARVASLRDDVERAQVQIAAGRPEEALPIALRVVEAARPLGYAPLLAEARLVEGRARAELNPKRRIDAVPALTEASTLAFGVGDNARGVEAWARRAWADGTGGEGASALSGLEVVEALSSRPSSSRFAQALLHNNVGTVHLARDRREDARAAFERALSEAQGVVGPGEIELVNVRMNLAITIEDNARRDALLAESEASLSRLLGIEHPMTLQTRWVRAMQSSSLRAVAALLAPMCETYSLHANLGQQATECWSELAHARSDLGDRPGALVAIERAVRAGVLVGPSAIEAEAYLLLWRGDPAAAARRFEDVLALAAGDALQSRVRRSLLQVGLGRAHLASGEPALARVPLEASVATLTAMASDHRSPLVQRRLGRARVELARVRAAMGLSAAEVAAVAEAALAWLASADGGEDSRRELAALAGRSRHR